MNLCTKNDFRAAMQAEPSTDPSCETAGDAEAASVSDGSEAAEEAKEQPQGKPAECSDQPSRRSIQVSGSPELGIAAKYCSEWNDSVLKSAWQLKVLCMQSTSWTSTRSLPERRRPEAGRQRMLLDR